jgi:hypothetical protein
MLLPWRRISGGGGWQTSLAIRTMQRRPAIDEDGDEIRYRATSAAP